MATKVLWFSRHEMTPEQTHALCAKFGDLSITQVARTIAHASELYEEIVSNDIIAIVAPISLQAEFLKQANGKPVIIAATQRVFDAEGNKATFCFKGWQKLEKIEVVTSSFA